MNSLEKYIFNAIKKGVWSGFCTPQDAKRILSDLYEKGADRAMLQATIAPEFAKKAAAEAKWTAETDCDRLDAAFEKLNKSGILSLQNSGNTLSDGIEDVRDALYERGRRKFFGFCFYSRQDTEDAIKRGKLYIAFGALTNNDKSKLKIARDVIAALESSGFKITWKEGDFGKRILIRKIDWKRRAPRTKVKK